MRQLAAGFLCLLPGVLFAATRCQDTPPSLAEQFKALRKEYDTASSSSVALNDSERMKFVGKVYKHRNELAKRFLALAEAHPNDPIALEALTLAVWQVNTIPWPVELVGENTTHAKALDIIHRNHIRSEKLGPLCERVTLGFNREYGLFLRQVMAENPNRSVQAIATLSLGRYLNNRMQRVELCREQPALAKEFAGLYGDEYFAELKRRDPEKTVKDIEAVFETAAKNYGDVKLPGGDTIAERVKTDLFEIRNLSVGKTAPEIHGEDQDGIQFNLSDYRGKVVLLDFWSHV